MSAPYILGKSVPLLPNQHAATFIRSSLTPIRKADVFFALFIGVSAASLRINREETEKGHNTAELPDLFRRRFDLWWNGTGEQRVEQRAASTTT